MNELLISYQNFSTTKHHDFKLPRLNQPARDVQRKLTSACSGSGVMFDQFPIDWLVELQTTSPDGFDRFHLFCYTNICDVNVVRVRKIVDKSVQVSLVLIWQINCYHKRLKWYNSYIKLGFVYSNITVRCKIVCFNATHTRVWFRIPGSNRREGTSIRRCLDMHIH